METEQERRGPMRARRMQATLDECIHCWQSCLAAMPYCAGTGGAHADAKHLEELATCAAACEFAAKILMLRSDMHTRVCELVAQACAACAASCGRLADDSHMRECAEICRSCAQSLWTIARVAS